MIADKNAGPRPSAGDVFVTLMFGVPLVRNIIATAVLLGIAAFGVRYAVQTRFFGVFTIVNYPYYGKLVADIADTPVFERRIGSPIAVDNAGVYCVRIDVGLQTSQCWLPVIGPRGTGRVFAKSHAFDRYLSTDLTLEAGGITDHVYSAR